MKNKIVIIVGPTGSGKTSLAVKLAKAINGELINADAYQVYQEISVGTAKPSLSELQDISIHLNGTVSIFEDWNIKKFQTLANETIKEITQKNKTPIIVGGSNLYINCLIYNYDLSASERKENFDNLSNEELYKFIEEKDKEVAHKIGLNNRKRLLRAYEILSEGKSLTKTNEKIYDYLIVFCEMDREKLYDKINNNVDRMLANGWVNEVNQLYKTYGDKLKSLNAFTAIGYRDILDSICNGITLDVDKIKTDTRHYAKRQLTWIKNKYDNLIVFNQENYEEVVGKVEEFLK